MKYQVHLVEEGELPDGVDVAIIERGPCEPAVMLLSGRPAQAWLAMRSYEATREAENVPSMLYAV